MLGAEGRHQLMSWEGSVAHPSSPDIVFLMAWEFLGMAELLMEMSLFL